MTDPRHSGDTEIRFAVVDCSLGALLIAESPRGLCAIMIDDNRDVLIYALQERFPSAMLTEDQSGLAERIAQILGLIANPGTKLDIPLDLRGTPFQHRVWSALREIPPGQTLSYGELAGRIGAPKAFRAVAGACAANALAVLIPCHRVVRSDSGLSGYRWGVERKRALLAREQMAVKCGNN